MRRSEAKLTLLSERVRRVAGTPLIVQYELDSGEQRTGTVDEMLAADGIFCRVIDGSSLKDLDKILNSLLAAAKAGDPGGKEK